MARYGSSIHSFDIFFLKGLFHIFPCPQPPTFLPISYFHLTTSFLISLRKEAIKWEPPYFPLPSSPTSHIYTYILYFLLIMDELPFFISEVKFSPCELYHIFSCLLKDTAHSIILFLTSSTSLKTGLFPPATKYAQSHFFVILFY